MADELERTTLFLVRRTLLEMLHDRGYWVEAAEKAMTSEEFLAAFGEKPNRRDLGMKTKRLKDNEEESVVRVQEARDLLERMHKENVHRAIFVLQHKMTPSAKQHLTEAGGIQFFEESELLVNVTRHTLIPKYEILSPDEKREFLKTTKIKEAQLPRMRTDDAVAKYYGLQAGTLTKWFRPGRQAGYRMVVPALT